VNKTVVTLGIAFFPRPEVGRWPLYKGEPTVGTPQQQLGFVFSKTQVAFMYDCKYRLEWTVLERFWFVLPTSIKYVSKQKNV